MSVVRFEKDGRIARIILNRPEVMNAIDLAMPQEIEDAVKRADTDPDIRHDPLWCGGWVLCWI